MSNVNERQYIQNFSDIIRGTAPDPQEARRSPYTAEAARAQSPEPARTEGNERAFASANSLTRMIRSTGSFGRPNPIIPVEFNTRSTETGGMGEGLAALSPRRRVVVPPQLGARPQVRQSVQPVSHEGRTPSGSQRMAGSRRSEHRSLDQLMEDSFTSDQELEDLMTASLDPNRPERRGEAGHHLPALTLEREIEPGQGWQTQIRDVSQINENLRSEIDGLIGTFERAQALRRQALRAGPDSDAGREHAVEACRAYQAFRQGRQALMSRASELPRSQRARVESWYNRADLSEPNGQFEHLIRRFHLVE